MTEKAYNRSICESCGDQFDCGANLDGCWCAEITILDHAANELKTKFRNCLCPECLKKYVQPIGDFEIRK